MIGTRRARCRRSSGSRFLVSPAFPIRSIASFLVGLEVGYDVRVIYSSEIASINCELCSAGDTLNKVGLQVGVEYHAPLLTTQGAFVEFRGNENRIYRFHTTRKIGQPFQHAQEG